MENNREQIDRIIANLDDTVATEVIPRLTQVQGALDGLDEFSRAIFNAGRNGEWLNQDILCADVGPPPAGSPVPRAGEPDPRRSSSAIGIGASARVTVDTGVANVLRQFAGPGSGGAR